MAEARDVKPVTEVVVDGNDVHVTVVGEIDASSAAPLQRRLDEIIESTTGAVVVDMSGVSFIDSMGIRVVVALHRRLSAQRRSLTLLDASAPTRRMFDLTGLGPVLGVEWDGPGRARASSW